MLREYLFLHFQGKPVSKYVDTMMPSMSHHISDFRRAVEDEVALFLAVESEAGGARPLEASPTAREEASESGSEFDTDLE